MAPFLVILLLLALGAGIIVWHTTGPHYGPSASPRKPAKRPATAAPQPVQTPDAVSPSPIATAEPEPLVRPADPFAHAPAPQDRERYH
jgi:hypothetical protein